MNYGGYIGFDVGLFNFGIGVVIDGVLEVFVVEGVVD